MKAKDRTEKKGLSRSKFGRRRLEALVREDKILSKHDKNIACEAMNIAKTKPLSEARPSGTQAYGMTSAQGET